MLNLLLFEQTFCDEWFLNIGIQLSAKKSINPLPKLPTTPNPYIVADIAAPNTACATNNAGAANKNVNSIGSVIPVKKPVNAAGSNRPATTFFFFIFSCYIHS